MIESATKRPTSPLQFCQGHGFPIASSYTALIERFTGVRLSHVVQTDYRSGVHALESWICFSSQSSQLDEVLWMEAVISEQLATVI